MTPKASAKPSHQPRGVLRCRTIFEIESVTLAKSWPGAFRRSASVWKRWSCSWRPGVVVLLAMAGLRHLRVRVAHRCQVGRSRPGVQFRKDAVAARRALELRDP